MSKVRIRSKYPCYPNGTCIPTTIYFVEMLTHRGIFWDTWTKIKGFDNPDRARSFAKTLGELVQ